MNHAEKCLALGCCLKELVVRKPVMLKRENVSIDLNKMWDRIARDAKGLEKDLERFCKDDEWMELIAEDSEELGKKGQDKVTIVTEVPNPAQP